MHLLHAAAAAAGEHERDGRADEHTDHDRDDDQHQVAAAAATRRWGGGRSRRRGVDGGRERGRSEGRRRGQGRGGRRGGRRRGLGGLRVKHNVGVEVGDGDRGLAVGGGGLVAALLLEVGRTRGIVGPVPHAHTDDEALRRSRGREDKRARSGQRRAVLRSEDTDHAREDVGVLGDGDGASRSLGVVGDRHVEIPRVRTDGHHGHRVEHGVSEASDQVCGARAGGGNAHTHPAGTLGVALGGKHLALLVAAEDVGDGFGAGESLVDLHGRAARVGEEHVNALPLKGLHENVTTLALLLIREAGDKVGGGLVLPDGAGPCGLPGDVQLLLGCSLAQVVRERGLN
mmetsp:Transcript_25361/g.80239  ORF Transcript_25361/g.80239 Transcript_25361/m.80239 type:complete len:343 (+) Transcript_25361:206-1234(+)